MHKPAGAQNFGASNCGSTVLLQNAAENLKWCDEVLDISVFKSQQSQHETSVCITAMLVGVCEHDAGNPVSERNA